MLLGATIVAGFHFGFVGVQISAAQIVKVSGDDPFADCQITVVSGETNFPNTRVEPYVAVNPVSQTQGQGKAPSNLIGVWQQDRWSDGGARGLVAGFSFDSGQTWGQTALPFSQCAPGGLQEERASDPWVSIGPDGIAYASSLSVSFVSASISDTAVAAVTSIDGGKTWQNLAVIRRDPFALAFNDKETVTADPVKPGTAYIVWDQGAGGHATTRFAKTFDGGVSWSPDKIIVNTVKGESTGGNQILVDPNTDVLYNFFTWAPPNSPLFFAAFVKSTDGGDTWSALQTIDQIRSIDVTGPNGEVIRTSENKNNQMLATLQANGVSEPIRAGGRGVAIDPHTGQLNVVWDDARFSGMLYDEIAISTSTDGGTTWSTTSRVNPPTGGVKFTPSVQVNGNGVVAVTYYDFRNFNGQKDTLPTDYWIVFSKDGGSSFEDEKHVAGSFNMLAAPLLADGFFLGDYEGLGSAGNAFVPFFVQTNCHNNSCDATSGGSRPTDPIARTPMLIPVLVSLFDRSFQPHLDQMQHGSVDDPSSHRL